MKKWIALMLSLLITLSVGMPTAAAGYYEDDVVVDPTAATPLYAHDIEAVIPPLADHEEPASIDLADAPVMARSVEDSNVPTMDISAYQNLDISKAINVTNELLSTNTAEIDSVATGNNPSVAAIENQAPVGIPEIMVINPDSQKGDQYTTGTLFVILTRFNNEDLCYDPEGGDIDFVRENYFPWGYIAKYTHPSGSWGGYLVLIQNAGVYPLHFHFIDDFGAKSGSMTITFEVVPRGNFETITDSFVSATDTKTYPITVDYSLANEYCLGVLRTGKSGFSVEVYDESNSLCKSTYVDGPFYQQDVNVRIYLPKPDGVTGEYTFRLVVSSSESKYVDGDSSFKLAYGAKSQQYYFFEDVTDSMELPYYTKFRNRKQIIPEYICRAATSDYGHKYRFTATGTEVVTLASTYGQYRFKILDATEFLTLFDSNTLPDAPLQVGDNSSYFTTVSLNFQAGQTYYVCVYDPNETDYRGSYEIMVGERKVFPAVYQREIPSTPVTSGNQYSFNINITVPKALPAYAETISYSAHSLGWGMYYDVLTPGAYNWRMSSSKYINFGYENEATPLIKADGQWTIRFKPTSTGTYPGATLIIHYWYEL